MNEEERWAYINALDERLLRGGVILSEWCSFIVCEADKAFVANANLAAIVTALAGVETYLRSEYSPGEKRTLFDIVEAAPLDVELKQAIHTLRKYRNRWVHVADPTDDADLLVDPEKYETELNRMASSSIETLRRVIYENQPI